MVHKIRVEIHGNNVTIEFEGFYGDACYREAERLYTMLKAKGLNVTIKRVVPKTTETETAVASTAQTKEWWW